MKSRIVSNYFIDQIKFGTCQIGRKYSSYPWRAPRANVTAISPWKPPRDNVITMSPWGHHVIARTPGSSIAST